MSTIHGTWGPPFSLALYYTILKTDSLSSQVRGIFVTLVQALPEMAGGALPSTSTVSVDGEVVHVGYEAEGEDVLLLALPDIKCNADDVRQGSRIFSGCRKFHVSEVKRNREFSTGCFEFEMDFLKARP